MKYTMHNKDNACLFFGCYQPVRYLERTVATILRWGVFVALSVGVFQHSSQVLDFSEKGTNWKVGMQD